MNFPFTSGVTAPRRPHAAAVLLRCVFIGCLLLLLGGNASATAAEDGATLTHGLAYERVRTLPASSAIELPRTAVVIDLRGTQAADTKALRLVTSWVEASSRPPLRLVLIDSSTASAVLRILESRQRFLMTLGAASPAITPDVAVAVSLRADQEARDALDAGKTPQDLLASKMEKRRYDEAAMVRDHANGVPVPESPPDLAGPDPAGRDESTPSSAAPSDENTVAAGTTTAPPVHDAVLQRAVHIFQSLVALKRITVD